MVLRSFQPSISLFENVSVLSGKCSRGGVRAHCWTGGAQLKVRYGRAFAIGKDSAADATINTGSASLSFSLALFFLFFSSPSTCSPFYIRCIALGALSPPRFYIICFSFFSISSLSLPFSCIIQRRCHSSNSDASFLFPVAPVVALALAYTQSRKREKETYKAAEKK